MQGTAAANVAAWDTANANVGTQGSGSDESRQKLCYFRSLGLPCGGAWDGENVIAAGVGDEPVGPQARTLAPGAGAASLAMIVTEGPRMSAQLL